jgi:hypothetical protein
VTLARATRLCWTFIAASSLALVLASACGYEGRSLDLFPSVALDGDLARCTSADDCVDDNRGLCVEGLCVECRSDVECGGNKPACLAGVCVTCTGPEHCPAQSACNVAAQRCAPACGDAAACSGPTANCDVRQGFCVECVGDSDCPEPGKPACDQPGGQCVECTRPEHCTGARARCDLTRHQCVECSADDDCAGGGRCDAMGRCQPGCIGDAMDVACMPAPPRP